jgi:hypothetical protein
MKLSEVQTRDKVPTGSPGDLSARLKSGDAQQPSGGWSLDYDAGVVTASKGDQTLYIPLGNVAYMRPEPKPVKAAKVA